ncbi:MAG: TraM recognition domain-containing protein [Desulfosporosinus sp.]|nr:TraM recognition domain-containing protein [Desulfosporosinus sp.]
MQGKLGAKWKDLALGLRAQIENIVSNEDLKRIITGDSGINLDQHMAEGGVIGINTALGKLKRSGDAFGQFMAMHLQSAAFRRPGTERTRIPHYLIIDEMSRYINADTEKFLSIAAEYRVAGIFAVQSFSQLEIGAGDLTPKAMKTAVLTNCRNKISFGGITYDDAEYFANELGKNWEVMRQSTYDGFAFASFLPKTYRDTEQEEYRIRPTDIQDGLPRFHFIHKLLRDGHPMKPGIALGQFVPTDWREKARTISNLNIPQKDEAPQHRGLFSLLKKHRQQSLKGGDTTTITQATESAPMNDPLNDSKESKKIIVKPKMTFMESDVKTQPSARLPETKRTNAQAENENQGEKAPNEKPEKRQVGDDQSSDQPFVFM